MNYANRLARVASAVLVGSVTGVNVTGELLLDVIRERRGLKTGLEFRTPWNRIQVEIGESSDGETS